MKPAPLRYERAETIDHAVALLGGPVRDVAVQVAANVMARSAWIS